MTWEKIVSKENKLIKNIGRLTSSSKYRKEQRAYVCEGEKLLREAVRDAVPIEAIIWDEADYIRVKETDPDLFETIDALDCRKALVDDALYSYISILENHFGPLFICAMPENPDFARGKYIALDGVQDPGNIGTILRTSEAFGIDGIILLPGCANVYQPKTVRAAMGSLFRQKIYHMEAEDMFAFAQTLSMPVYVTALYEDSFDIGQVDLSNSIVIIGSEGHGAKRENIDRSSSSLFIPMKGKTESLNAAIAAAIVMWEMGKCHAYTGYGLESLK